MVNSVGEAFSPPTRAKAPVAETPRVKRVEEPARVSDQRVEAPKDPHRGRRVDISV